MKQLVALFLHYTPWSNIVTAHIDFLTRALITLAVTFPFNLIAALAFFVTTWRAVRGRRTEVLKMIRDAKGEISAGRESLVRLSHMPMDIKEELLRARAEMVEDGKGRADQQLVRQLEQEEEQLFSQLERDLGRGEEPFSQQELSLENEIDELTEQSQGSFIDT